MNIRIGQPLAFLGHRANGEIAVVTGATLLLAKLDDGSHRDSIGALIDADRARTIQIISPDAAYPSLIVKWVGERDWQRAKYEQILRSTEDTGWPSLLAIQFIQEWRALEVARL
jgi:hypothetical protein